MTNLVTKLLGLPEEIVVGKPSSAHLYRWTIFGTNHFKVCLQHTVGDDGSSEFCKDPMQFISFGVARNLYYPEPRSCEVIPDRAAWTVLIGKKPVTRKNMA
jgi:hypothetical protein